MQQKSVHVYRLPLPPRPLPPPPPRPRPLACCPPPALGTTARFSLGASSTKRASKFNDSGNSHALMVLPLTDNIWTLLGALPLTVTLTLRKWQFIVASTPTTVPCKTVPFFSSIVTCSRFSFCRNFTSFILDQQRLQWTAAKGDNEWDWSNSKGSRYELKATQWN